MKKFLEDFKAFAMKGNVIDMAVGVVVGGAFSKIVTSMVNDIIMPLVAMLTGKVQFTDLKLVLIEGSKDVPAVTLAYGNFIQNIVDFLIIAFCIFMVIKFMGQFRKKEEEVQEEKEPELTLEQQLLMEIRDSLKNK